MGLDMYLTKKVYVGANYEHNNISGSVEIFKNREKIDIDFSKISYIEEAAGYWRKANEIHKWFVDNVQEGVDNCGDYYVSTEDMQKLLNVVNIILEDNNKASELLPTQSGFFFGGTEYDEWYFRDLNQTKTILEKAIESDNGEFYYHSSW